MTIRKQIYLASASPRREQLLTQIGISFEAFPVVIDEGRRTGEEPQQLVSRLALQKAQRAQSLSPSNAIPLPLLGADTIVECDGHILGKPADRDEAFASWRLLSNRSHNVFTAVSVIAGKVEGQAAGQKEVSMLSHSRVTFRAISEQEMQWYWDTHEPLDKAGDKFPVSITRQLQARRE